MAANLRVPNQFVHSHAVELAPKFQAKIATGQWDVREHRLDGGQQWDVEVGDYWIFFNFTHYFY